MTEKSSSSRRAFLKGGALVAAPLAAMGAPAAAALAVDDRRARGKMVRLEDEKAIRTLHETWMRQVNAGDFKGAAEHYSTMQCSCVLAGVCAVKPDMASAPDSLIFAKDGNRASASYAAIVETETLIAPENTLAQMLHAQGDGTVRNSEQRLLKADYVRTRQGGWAIEKLAFEKI